MQLLQLYCNEDRLAMVSSPMVATVSSCPSPVHGLIGHVVSRGKLGMHLGMFVT